PGGLDEQPIRIGDGASASSVSNWRRPRAGPFVTELFPLTHGYSIRSVTAGPALARSSTFDDRTAMITRAARATEPADGEYCRVPFWAVVLLTVLGWTVLAVLVGLG